MKNLKRRISRILCLLMTLAMIGALPMGAQAAATNVVYENKLPKEFDLEGYHYYSMNDALGTNQLNSTALKKFATLQMEDWATIAFNIFRWGSVEKGNYTGESDEGFSGVTSNFYTNHGNGIKGWEYYFNDYNNNDSDPHTIDLEEWLQKDNQAEAGAREGKFARSTGVIGASSLNAVRVAMAQEIDDAMKNTHDYSYFLEYGGGGQTNNQNGALPLLNNSGSKKVFYNIVTTVNKPDATSAYFYNSYGIALYDFELTPIVDKNVPKKDAVLVTNDPDAYNDDYKVATTMTNQSSKEGNYTSELENSTTQTITNTISQSQEYSFTETVGSETTLKADLDVAEISQMIKLEVSATQALRTGWEKGTECSETVKNNVSASVALPPHTGVQIIQTIGKHNNTFTYTCPVAIRYKVAVFSMSGYCWGNDITNGATCSNFCTIFGYGSEEGGYGAPENLRHRGIDAYTNNTEERSYGQVQGFYRSDGYANPNLDMLDWEEIYDIKTNLKDDYVEPLATKMPFISEGASMNVVSDGKDTTVTEILPLYALAKVKLEEGENLYNMSVGDTLNLKTLVTGGYNDSDVPFYGFNPEKGSWVLCDSTGKPYSDAELENIDTASIEVNAATGRAILNADNPGEVYMTWRMSDDAVYTLLDGNKITPETEGITYPVVQIKVKEAPVDLTGYRVEASGEAEIAVGDTLNLTNAFSPAVYDNTDVLITNAVPFEAQDQTTTSPVTITEDGEFSATKEGEYKVRPYYEKGGSKITYDGWLTVTVKAAPAVTYMTADNPEAVKITGTNPSAGFALASYVKFFDQYDNAWEGETPALTFALPAGTEGAEIDENGMLTVTKGGTYAVTASAEGLEDITFNLTVLALDELTIADESNVLAEFKFNKGDNKVDLSGLTYTGKDQNGEAWDMTDETVVWHVMKEGAETEETLDGNVFTAPSDGTYNVYATSGAAGDVKSNELTLTVLPEPVLSALVISGPITEDGLGIGDGYAIDVTKDITVEALDQYEESFELTNEELVWTADGRYAKLSGNTLTGKAEGTGTLTLSIAVPGAEDPVTSNTLEFSVWLKPYVSEFWADDAGTILEEDVFDLKDVVITAHDQNNDPYVLSDEEKASIVWEITDLGTIKSKDVDYDEAAGTIVVHEKVLGYGDTGIITVKGTFTNPNGHAPEGTFRITVEQKPILDALVLAKKDENAVISTEQVKYCMDFFTVTATDQYNRAFDLTSTPLTFTSDNAEAFLITDAEDKDNSTITAGKPNTSAKIKVSSVNYINEEVVSNEVEMHVPRVRRLTAVDFTEVPEYLPVNTQISMEELGAKCFDELNEEYSEEDLAAYPAKITYSLDPEVDGKMTEAKLDTAKNILRTGGTRGYIILYANAVNATTSKKILDGEGNEIVKEAKVWIGPIIDIDKVTASQDTFHVKGGTVTISFTGKILEDSIVVELLDKEGASVQSVTTTGSDTEQTAELTIPDNTSLTDPAVYTVQYTVCGDDDGADVFAPPANITITVENHTLVKTEAKEATCEEDGNIEYWQCDKCKAYFADENADKEIKEADTVIAAIGHAWDEGAVTTEATCETDGVKTYTCQNDKTHTKTEAIPAIGHAWDEGVVTKEATCEEAGVKTYTCKNDPTHVKTEEIPALGHAWDAGKIKKAAKARANGTIVYTCANDASHKKTEPLPVLLMNMTASGKKALKLKWTAEPLADGYEIYTTACKGKNDTNPFKLKKTITKNSTTTWTWKKLKTGNAYKAYVKAYKKIDGKKKYIAVSYAGHAIAGNTNQFATNPKSLKLKEKSVTVKVGKTYKIKGTKITGVKKGKKVLNHTAKFRYAVTDSSIAKVSKAGAIKGVKPGVCKVYVIVGNGLRKVMKVTVE